MRRSCRLRALWILLCVAACAQAVAEDGAISIGSTRTLRSQVLQEDRVLNIYLPPSYAASHRYRRYPVLYVRDGGKFFHSFTGTVAQLTSDATPRAPEMIVVGILETDRVRDSSATHSLKGFTGKEEPGYEKSGGGASFLRFINTELVPYIDNAFSTSGYRLYCGYSFTGLSVIDAVLDANSPFDAFIAIDPSWWWDDYAAERKTREVLASGKLSARQLFLAASGETYPTQYFIKSRDVESLALLLRGKRGTSIDWTFKRYAGESHHSMPQAALYDALSHVFRGHQPTLDELYSSPDKVKQRYQRLSERLGETIVPNEGVLNSFGYQFLYQLNDRAKAAKYFEMNAGYYPASPNVWDSLGELFVVMGDSQEAIKMYQKVLALDPENENARKRLVELRH